MHVKFDKTNFFIISPNPTDSEKVAGEMVSNSYSFGRPSNIPHGWDYIYIPDDTNLTSEEVYHLLLSNT